MTMDLGFIHRFLPGTPAGRGFTLLILNGTGGDENDLIPLGQELLPGAAVLSPRGKVLEHGMPRFFRRLVEGVFDLEDLKIQTADLARFIAAASRQYALDDVEIIAVGYSNGANIASSILLTHPSSFSAAVLFRPMVLSYRNTFPISPGSLCFSPLTAGIRLFLRNRPRRSQKCWKKPGLKSPFISIQADTN